MTLIGSTESADHAAIATFVASQQRDPSRHVTYVGEEADSIRHEFSSVDRWVERLRVVTDEDELAGVLLADIDEEMRRVWWWGPWADTPEIAARLFDEAREQFGGLFDEEEMAPDSRNVMLRTLAAGRGFVEETWSSVLTRTAPAPSDDPRSARVSPAETEAVARLHDELFPGTHTSGDRLVESERGLVRCAVAEGGVAGYIAFEIQPDGTGYIDYLGVDPASRRRGLGRALVIDACRDLAEHGVSTVHLTVRADAPGAIELYRSVGFAEERRIVPCRRGFTLG